MPRAMTLRTVGRALRSLLGIAIVVWLVATFARRWHDVALPALSVSPFDVATAFVAGALAIAALPALFVLELRALGLAREGLVPFYVRLWFQGYFYRYVPGKVMLLAERVRLGRAVGIPDQTSVVLVVWETVLLLGGAGVLAPLGLVFANDRSVLLGSLLCVLVLVGFLPMVRIVARRVPAFGASLVPLAAVPLRIQAGLVAGYAGVWLLFGISFAATCRWFVSGQDAALGAALWFVSAYVAGLLAALLPAGIGVREAVLVAGLGRWIPPEDALAMALASRIAMTAIELLLIGLSRFATAPTELAADG